MNKWYSSRLTAAGIGIGICGLVLSAISVVFIGILLNTEVKNELAHPKEFCGNEKALCFSSVRKLSAAFVILLIGTFTYALLIYGAVKKNPSFLLPWLIVKGFSLGVATFRVIFTWGRRELKVELIMIFIYVLIFSIWYTVFLLYKQLKTLKGLEKAAEVKSSQDSNIPYKKYVSSITV